MPIKSYRDFECYKNALLAIPPTFKALERFPAHKATRLIEQIRSAAHSVPSNIAEGYGRKENEVDFKRFLRIAMGSCNQVIARLTQEWQKGIWMLRHSRLSPHNGQLLVNNSTD